MRAYSVRSGISVAITGATNAIPIVITCAAHELVTGDLVDIEGVLGNTNANLQDKAVTVVSSTTFSLAGIKGNGDWLSGGTVYTQEASTRARDYAAATAATGTIHSMPVESKPGDRFNFYVDAASDPTTTNKEVDIIVYGRATPDSDWFQVQQIDEAVTFAQSGSGRWLATALDLPIQPELRMDIVASASSTNTCKGWIAI